MRAVIVAAALAVSACAQTPEERFNEKFDERAEQIEQKAATLEADADRMLAEPEAATVE